MSAFVRLDGRAFWVALAAAPMVALSIRALFRSTQGTSEAGILVYKSAPKTSSEQDIDSSAYPPDALPGSRDVDTPYGSIRVYEWGPENGRKVLFLHGISTPCVACAQMARRLVEQRGCRVMLFDLFGRGYSDAPDVLRFKQDIRLFTSQILLVLASSPLPWTGKDNGFTLVGYSLGGGIGATFTSYFPHLIRSLVLIAPAGLMRETRISWSSRLIYGGFLPVMIRDYLVRKRIVGSSPKPKTTKTPEVEAGVPAVPLTESELSADNPEFSPGSTAPLFPNSTVSAADSVVWQVYTNAGFLPSFISSIQNAPITNQHDRWQLIGSRLSAQKTSSTSENMELGLEEGKVLLIFGKADGVVVPEETAPDAIQALGEGNTRVEMLDGGHDVPITNAQGCVDVMRDFWAKK